MKKILNIFFVTLGVIFFVIILIGIYFFITDPLNLKPLIFKSGVTEISVSQNNFEELETNKNTSLSDTQKSALETLGIDPSQIPSEITEEQESCFIEKLGTTRVAEIKAGDSPTATEFFKARSCID